MGFFDKRMWLGLMWVLFGVWTMVSVETALAEANVRNVGFFDKRTPYTVCCEGLFGIEILCERTKVSVETVVAGANVCNGGCFFDMCFCTA